MLALTAQCKVLWCHALHRQGLRQPLPLPLQGFLCLPAQGLFLGLFLLEHCHEQTSLLKFEDIFSSFPHSWGARLITLVWVES